MPKLDITATLSNAEVRQTGSDAGNGVFATSDILLGDAVISVDRPLLVALDATRLQHTCYQCYRQLGEANVESMFGLWPCPLIRDSKDDPHAEVKLSRCAGCKTVRYCGKACQKASWNAYHALECPIFKAAQPQVLPNHVRAALRVLLLIDAGRIKPEDWNAFTNCLSHRQTFEKEDHKQELFGLKQAAILVTRCTTIPLEEDYVVQILQRLRINSFTLQTQFHDPLGLAMHPMLAKLNHSCDPNCYVRFLEPNSLTRGTAIGNPGSIVVTPHRAIKAGEQLTIAYIDTTMPRRLRKQELANQYFFDCNCVKCAESSREYPDLSSAKREETFKLQDDAYKLDIDRHKEFSLLTPKPQIEVLKSQIKSFFTCDPDWPPTRYPLPQSLFTLAQVHITLGNFASAFQLIAFLYTHVDPSLYSAPVHPLRLTHAILLNKLMGCVIDPPVPPTGVEATIIKQLNTQTNLMSLCHALPRRILAEASQTWTNQPWPWMMEMIGPQGRLSASMARYGHPELSGMMDVQENRELRRLSAYGDKTLQGWKRG